MRRLLSLIGLVIFSQFATQSVQAMSVSPILTDLAPVGRESRSAITVVNTGATTLPVEVAVNQLDLGENGERTLTPRDDDFLIFPPQAMIPAGASQVFRLQWAGEPDIERSRSYAFMINQIPVTSESDGTVLELVYSVVVYVNVGPLQGESDLTLVRAGPVNDGQGGRKIELVVENRGSRHDYLSRDRILLQAAGGGWRREIRASEFASAVGIGLVQPGKTRRFLLPVEPPAGLTAVNAEVSVDEER
ncbi:fimbria/pilus periplasmic chaperone [Defluviicoccus vanus]|uniref:Fimbria/pilus periplasmic chaperone n=1 Tax=Defluviicoccus vanus TaxID=111831 RepID=A0A7H1N2V5_9PROT|nr:fimbria/pilus periplasmic chaperone [Defluviicoccus vanus]QNT70041.1 fimbria/pilus periplasmic chaperone [Defluviicoccus vanus]